MQFNHCLHNGFVVDESKFQTPSAQAHKSDRLFFHSKWTVFMVNIFWLLRSSTDDIALGIQEYDQKNILL